MALNGVTESLRCIISRWLKKNCFFLFHLGIGFVQNVEQVKEKTELIYGRWNSSTDELLVADNSFQFFSSFKVAQ